MPVIFRWGSVWLGETSQGYSPGRFVPPNRSFYSELYPEKKAAAEDSNLRRPPKTFPCRAPRTGYDSRSKFRR